MKKRIGNKIISAIFICALLTLSVVLPIIESDFSSVNSNPVSDAFAGDKISTQTTNLGQMLKSNGKFDSKIFWQLIDQVTGETGSNKGNYLSRLNHTYTSEDFRTNNNNLDIAVQIGDFYWTATYLSSGNGDPILTLWLANSNITSPFSVYSTDNRNYTYPSGMYGTSYVRAVALNNGGTYATSKTTAIEVEKKVDSPWAIFTNENVSGNIVNYLEVPENMSWQVVQNASSINFSPGSGQNQNNEGLTTGCSGGTTSFLGKTGYDAWGTDTLWIPSIAECWNDKGIWKTSLNQCSNDSSQIVWTRSGVSGQQSYHNDVWYLNASGSTSFAGAQNEYVIRPAFHLNLRKAAEGLSLDEPKPFETVYNGEVQTLDTLKSELAWYSTDYANPSAVKVEYLNEAGNVLTESALPKNVGTYQIRFTIIDTENVKWWDYETNTSQIRTVSYKITEKSLEVNLDVSNSPPIATPTNLCESDTALADTILRIRYSGRTGAVDYDSYDEPNQVGTYYATVELNPSVTGSKNYKLARVYKEQIIISTKAVDIPEIDTGSGISVWSTYNGEEQFYIIDYDRNLMEISIADAYVGKFDWDGEYIIVKNAGVYKDALKLKLKNAYNKVTGEGRNVWDTSTNDVSDKYLSFELNKMELKLDFRTDDPNGIIKAPIGASFSVGLVLNDGHTNYKPVGKDIVSISITASRNGTANPVTVYSDLQIKSTTANSVTVNLDISGLRMEGTYVIKLLADENNYDVSMVRDISLVLSKTAQSADLIWWLKEDGNDTDFSKNAAVGVYNVDFDVTKLVYNGKTYSIYATAPLGYSISEEVVTVKKGTVLAIDGAIDAGEYVSTVKITKDGESEAKAYSVNWKIEKALFDLSDVKWLNNGKVEYNDGQDVNPVIDPATLPAGLTVNGYSGINVGNVAGDGGIVTVTFKLEDNYANNYELPAKDGKGINYTFNGDGDFEWDKDWEVVPGIIKLEWIEKQVQDINGTMFNVLVLKDPRVEGKIDYLYYETDSQGNIDTSKQPLTADQIEVSATARKYYKAFPSIKSSYAGGYEFDGGEADYSGVFIVGGGATLITVSLEKNTFEYNGKPVAIKVIINGTATVGNLTFTYYKGDIVDEANKVDGVPVDAGNYVVVIGSNSGSVMIEGETQFEFTITRSKVSKEWKMGAKPPVLNLKYGQINGIEYEIIDGSGNVITDISQITAGTYKIRAKIKDSVNYIFEDDTFETEYVEFTVREGDQLYDPTDPDNPNYPKEDDTDNPEPPPGGGDGGSVLDKIKEFFNKLIENNFPLWQVATSAVALLLTLIFMIKSIQYGNRKKKAKGEAKKYNTNVAGLLPIFAPNIVWLNLSNMIWSIIAFSLCGVMLLMFITMLITRKGWKKAELAKESAMSAAGYNPQNGNQNVANSNNALIEDLRRELQSLTQVNKESSDSGNSALEQRLMEMEERRREEEIRHREEMAALREEQQKRDEAMKIMLANMMGRQQSDGNMGYAAMDDTDLLVQKVIAGLLPAVQQMMPEATAYLAAPSEQNDELIALVEEQKALVEEQSEEMRNMAAAHSEEMRAMTEKMCELQEQLTYMSQERCEAVLLPDTAVAADQSEEIKSLNAKMELMQQKMDMMSAMSVDDLDDDDLDDDEEEWDSILDEDDDDFVEAVIIEEDGTVKKTYPNFRMRLKQSSDKNREWYAAVKNLFCSQKGVTYRVYKRVEKIRYQGQVIAVIGIAKRSIKLWLALKPYEYDARRYHHKDVSDKPRFVDVPMYVRVSSDRALTRAQELILALFQELNMEARKRYNDRSIQELIFTLKHNKLLTNKHNKGLLCEVMHVHDCDVLSDELAEKCIESKNVDSIDESLIETLKLDDIDAKFQDGNRVTLEKLKKVGLVSEECTGYTVTAGQRLTKPLIIVANDFKLSAVKMITLTGGRAIKLNKI